jgi:hypothetical protein
MVVPQRKSTKNTSFTCPTHHLIGRLVIRCCQADQQGQEVGEGGGRQAVLALVPELGGDHLQGSFPYVGVLAAEQAAQRAQEHGRGQQGQAALQHLLGLWGKINSKQCCGSVTHWYRSGSGLGSAPLTNGGSDSGSGSGSCYFFVSELQDGN